MTSWRARRQRPSNRAVVCAALALLASGPTVRGAEAPANALLITLDTFRGDYLGANGSRRGATPCLDRLAAAGANFTRARAQVPLSLPSHASILTGLNPRSHGLRDNGAGALAGAATTLAEVLHAGGYVTAAFVGSFVLDHRFGLDQGFDHYDDNVAAEPSMLERVEAERDGGEVVAAFEDWLAEHLPALPGEPEAPPFLAWIHLYDPHAPYAAPEPFRDRYRGDPYAAEIAYTDALVCRAVAALEARGGLDRTLVAVVGDHGEGLGEHRETTHALLIYNSTLHVPMLLWAPGLVPAAAVPDLVRTIDLAPTLLDYLGQAAGLGEGVSLRSRIEGRRAGAAPPPELAAASESLYGDRHLGWSPLFGLEEGRFRFIEAPEPELYDLERDPGETRNLFAEQPETARRLAERLATLLPGEPEPAKRPDPALDEEAMAQLRSLGYLAGSGPRTAAAAPADPKRKIGVWERLQLGMGLYGRGDYRGSARELEDVLQSERDIPLLYEYLASSYVRLEAWDSFERLHELARARGIESAAVYLDLGRLHARRGSPAAAEAAFERALALEPMSVNPRQELGELYRASGRHRQALDAYRAALAINPGYVFAWNGLGVTLSATGEPTAALAAFERAAELAPNDARGLLNLAVQLERMGRRQEALRRYERALELAGGDGSSQAWVAASEAIRRLRPER